MKLHDITSARLVRDASIEAMDALNAIIVETAPHISTAEEMDLRLAVGKAMAAILENLVDPVLRDYPELDVDEDTWGAIANARARERQERALTQRSIQCRAGAEDSEP